ncbi:flavin reductase family protein [Dermatobacter hominis]|nr:flavin reductase family protein [Dermatobacter hominis]
MGSVDPPMYVVTARGADGEPVGCLVGFATQVSIRPPRFAVLVSRLNHTFGPAMAAEHLVVHVLRKGDDDLARRFGGETADDLPDGGVDKFVGLAVRDGPGGAPVIDGLDWFGGRVFGRYDCGDHVAVVLDPEGGEAPRAALPAYGLQDAFGVVDPGHPA